MVQSVASLPWDAISLIIYLRGGILPLAAQCRSLVVVAMINVRARTRTSRWRSEGGQCRGAFAAASSILTGALLLIHQRREKTRREGRKERKQRHFSAVYLESQYYIDYERGAKEGEGRSTS